jgi:WD40 repeat protein
MRTLSLPRENCYAIAYTSDGRFLVSFSSLRQIRIWDLVTFTQRFACRLHASATGRAILPSLLPLANGMLLVAIQIWDVTPALNAARQPSPQPLPGPLDSFRLDDPRKTPPRRDRFLSIFDVAPDGRSISGLGRLWSREGWNTECYHWDGEGYLRYTTTRVGQFTRSRFAPDGNTLALAAGGLVLLWDSTLRQELVRLNHTSGIERLAFAPDGRLLAVAAGRCVWLWDVAEGRLLTRFPAFRKYAEALAFSPDGQCLAAGSGEGEVRLWDVASLREIARHDWGIGAVHDLAFAPDSMTVAAAGHRNTIVIWDRE